MWLELILAAFFGLVLYGLYWFLTPYLQAIGRPHPLSLDLSFVNTQSPRDQYGNLVRSPYPNIFQDAVLHLSVVVPAYNEEKRLPVMLQQTISYLQKRYAADNKFTSEIIIVDDGSKDGTANLVIEYSQKYTSEFIRLLKLPFNMGKGGAVQCGMLHARGKYVLFADADGASDFECYPLLENALMALTTQSRLGIAIGSRAHLAEKEAADEADAIKAGKATITRTPLRKALQKTFHLFMSNLSGLKDIKDTQCGFKLFTRETVKYVFLNQRIQRWCFDVELLYLAKAQAIPIVEIPINWQEIDGSKVEIVDASLTMGRDLVMIRVLYGLGLWKIAPTDSFLGLCPK